MADTLTNLIDDTTTNANDMYCDICTMPATATDASGAHFYCNHHRHDDCLGIMPPYDGPGPDDARWATDPPTADCPRCDGAGCMGAGDPPPPCDDGWVYLQAPCPRCNGAGVVAL